MWHATVQIVIRRERFPNKREDNDLSEATRLSEDAEREQHQKKWKNAKRELWKSAFFVRFCWADMILEQQTSSLAIIIDGSSLSNCHKRLINMYSFRPST